MFITAFLNKYMYHWNQTSREKTMYDTEYQTLICVEFKEEQLKFDQWFKPKNTIQINKTAKLKTD